MITIDLHDLKRELTGFSNADPSADDGLFDATRRRQGLDMPSTALTMVGIIRLDSLRELIESVLADDIPGDLIEAGVWRGGASIYMRAVLNAYGAQDRLVWLADTFAGMPPSSEWGERGYRWPELLAVSEAQVAANIARYGLTAGTRLLAGPFAATLPTAPIERLALIRLDADLYMSTMDALTCLYPHLSPGGYVVVDDYNGISMCRDAVDQYREENGITEPIETVDWTCVYWRRSQAVH